MVRNWATSNFMARNWATSNFMARNWATSNFMARNWATSKKWSSDQEIVHEMQKGIDRWMISNNHYVGCNYLSMFSLQYLSHHWSYTWMSNYANPVYGVATICHQVRWLRWGHPSLFHTATSLLNWYKMFCVRDISYRLIWMEFISMFSVYAQSGTHSRFNW